MNGNFNLIIVLMMLWQMVVSVAAGPWDALFGGGNLPAFVVGAVAAAASGILAFTMLPSPPPDIPSNKRAATSSTAAFHWSAECSSGSSLPFFFLPFLKLPSKTGGWSIKGLFLPFFLFLRCSRGQKGHVCCCNSKIQMATDGHLRVISIWLCKHACTSEIYSHGSNHIYLALANNNFVGNISLSKLFSS